MSYRPVLALSLLSVTMSCKGTANCSPGGPMTVAATVDGQAYCGPVENVLLSAGTINVASSNAESTISVNFGFGDTGGTLMVGQNVSLSFQVETPSGTWTAAEMVGSGSMIVDTSKPSSATGTFTFVGQPLPGATGTKLVDNGSFSVTF